MMRRETCSREPPRGGARGAARAHRRAVPRRALYDTAGRYAGALLDPRAPRMGRRPPDDVPAAGISCDGRRTTSVHRDVEVATMSETRERWWLRSGAILGGSSLVILGLTACGSTSPSGSGDGGRTDGAVQAQGDSGTASDGASPLGKPCSCQQCSGEACRGVNAGCSADELCVDPAAGGRCARVCSPSSTSCSAGTTCEMAFDCDTPVSVCR